MADEIGRGVIVLSVDGSEVATGLAQVKSAVDSMVASTTASANKLATAMSGPARNMVSAFNQLSGVQAKQTSAYSSQASAIDKLVGSMTTAQTAANKLASAQAAASASQGVAGGNASANATAQLAAAAANASSMVGQLGAAQARQIVQSQAAAAAASQAANATTQQTAAQQAQIASYGSLAKSQQAWVNSVQKEVIATNGARDAVRTFEANLKQVPQGVYQPLIAALNAELAAKEANRKQEQQIAADNAYIQSLERKRDAIGKTTIELMRMEAAQRNMANASVGPGLAGPPAPSRAMGIINQIESRQAAQEAQAFVTNLEKRVQALQVASLKPAEQLRRSLLGLEKDAAKLGVSAQSAPLIASLRNQAAAMDKGTMSAKQLQQALRLLPAQFTDIFTSIASGMPLWLIMIQQGGQIKDSFGGVGNAFSEVRKYASGLLSNIGPLRLAMMGLGGVAAIVFGTWATLAKKASDETMMLRRTLINAGGMAGNSDAQMRDVGRSVAQSAGGTTTDATKIAAAFAATGRATIGNIDQITKAAKMMERELGISVDKSVDAFLRLQESPLDASVKLNETTNYLTASIYQQIEAYVKAGENAKAAALATNAYFDAQTARAQAARDQLTGIEWAWRGVKDGINAAIEAVRNFFKEDDPSEKLAKARANLAEQERRANQGRGNLAPGGREATLKVARELVEQLEAQVKAQQDSAKATSDATKLQANELQAQLNFAKLQERLLEGIDSKREERIQKEIARQKELLTIRNASGEVIKSLFTPQMEKDIREMLSPKPPKQTPKAVQEDAGERMLRELKGREEILKVELEELKIQEKMTAAQREYAKWESDILILKSKSSKLLTNDQKQILAKENELRAQHQVNIAAAEKVEIEKQDLELLKLIEKQLLADAKAQEKMLADARELAQLKWEQLKETDVSLSAERDAMSQSDDVAKQLEQRRKIEDEFYKERRKALRDYIGGDITEEGYRLQLQILDGYQRAVEEKWSEHFRKIKEMQSDPALGMQKAFVDYIDEAENKFEQFRNLTTNVFRGLEDVLADWVTTGKLSFTDFLKSFNAMVARMMMQMLIAKALQAALGINTGGSNVAALGSGLKIGGSSPVDGMGGGSGIDFGGGSSVPGMGGGSGITAGGTDWGGSYTGGSFDPTLLTTKSSASVERPILVTQHITLGGDSGNSAPDRDQMKRMFKDGVRAGIAEARSRNSPGMV
jgi:lambda family phage tail tape measure protein